MERTGLNKRRGGVCKELGKGSGQDDDNFSCVCRKACGMGMALRDTSAQRCGQRVGSAGGKWAWTTDIAGSGSGGRGVTKGGRDWGPKVGWEEGRGQWGLTFSAWCTAAEVDTAGRRQMQQRPWFSALKVGARQPCRRGFGRPRGWRCVHGSGMQPPARKSMAPARPALCTSACSGAQHAATAVVDGRGLAHRLGCARGRIVAHQGAAAERGGVGGERVEGL